MLPPRALRLDSSTAVEAVATSRVAELNAYAMEDPITALEDAGYTDLAAELIEDASSFVFDGQAGKLDYALANEALFGR